VHRPCVQACSNSLKLVLVARERPSDVRLKTAGDAAFWSHRQLVVEPSPVFDDLCP
jgi:hypothetical protein